MRLLFYGSPDYTVEYLQLLQENHTITGIITAPDAATGRGRKLHRPAPARWADTHGIPCFQPNSLKDAALQEQINQLHSDLGVVVAYGRILPKELFDHPQHGYINLHFSLLPAFRGASPIESALLCGADTSGVSVQRITAELDAGDLLVSKEVPVTETDHFPELFQKLHQTGLEVLPAAIHSIETGKAAYTEQDETGIVHCGKISACDRDADWQVSGQEMCNRIRAFSGHRTVRSRCRGEEILIHRAAPGNGEGSPGTVLRADKSGLEIACKSGSIFLLLLQRQNRKPMDYTSFLNGFRLSPGETFDTTQE